MKRNMELIRKIMFAVEANEGGHAPDEIKVEGYSEDQISYHCYLIGEAGFAAVINTTSRGSSGPEGMIRHLTWEGHEFLDDARDPTTYSIVDCF